MIIRHSPKNLHVYNYCIAPAEMRQWLKNLSCVKHFQVGMKPKLTLPVLWELLTTRSITQELKFHYCSSLAMSYLGHAVLNRPVVP